MSCSQSIRSFFLLLILLVLRVCVLVVAFTELCRRDAFSSSGIINDRRLETQICVCFAGGN